MKELVKELKDAITTDKSTKPYDTTATVVRTEGDTIWVHIDGGVDETPVAKTISAKPGDIVKVRVSGGSAWIQGNESAPPTDDTLAILARENANAAQIAAHVASDAAKAATEDAGTARTAAAQAVQDAAEAKTAADNASEYAARALGNLSTVQNVTETLNWITAHGTMTLTSDIALDPTHVYFVQDNNGDYTVGGTKYAVVTEPDVADISTYYELSIDQSLNNYVATHLAVDSEGLWIIPDAGGNKVLIATGQGSTYSSAGTYIVGKVNNVDTVLAQFTTSGVQIGQANSGNYAVIDEDSFDIYHGGAEIVHFGYGEGNSVSGTADAPYTTQGSRKTTTTPYSSSSTYNLGDMCVYNNKVYVCKTAIETPEAWNADHWMLQVGNYSYAEGTDIIASGYTSHAEGWGTAALGGWAHAEGSGTIAGHSNAHSEGSNTKALGSSSHAEGTGSRATASFAHAEGDATVASGKTSHSEGEGTIASGHTSHAQNEGTVAQRKSQTVIGEYNKLDTQGSDYTERGKYAFIIGNGTATSASRRSNAFDVDWNGETRLGIPYHEGSSSTAAGTITKVVTASGFTLTEGAIVAVTFTNANTGSVSLNVNSTGSKYAYYNGSRLNSTNGNWAAGETVLFRYDGTYYQKIDGATVGTTYSSTDADLIYGLTSLGWTSDVIE